MDTIKQGPDDSVITYNAQFQTLAAQAKATDFVSLQEKYLKGVLPQIAREIIKTTPQPKVMVTDATLGKGVYDLAIEAEATFKRLDKLANAIGITNVPSNRSPPVASNRRPFQPRFGFNRNYAPNRNPANYRSNQDNQKPTELKRLSPAERTELMAQGRCLRCREKGHFARNCPKNQAYIRNIGTYESNSTFEDGYGTIFDQQGPTIAQATTSNNNPFRTQPNKPNLVEIKAAIKDLSVGEFSELIQDIEAKEDF